MPRVTFVDPEVATIGISELAFIEKFADQGRVLVRQLTNVERAVCEHEESQGFFKLLVTPSDGKIHGATIVCARAGEIINELAVAIKANVTIKEISKTIHAYPSFSVGLQSMCYELATEGVYKGFKGHFAKMLKKT